MLILNRRIGEALTITHPDGTEIIVAFLGMRAGHLRIGTLAPRHVKIDREEVAARKRREPPTGNA
jgi:carbon storage regulator CsrA